MLMPHEPRQAGGGHPVGNKFPFTITAIDTVATKDNTGGMVVVDMTSPAGTIQNRYNLFNQSAKAVEIAQGQFSALCRAVGIFNVGNKGVALIGGKGTMDVGYQKGHEPTADNPAGGYVEVKKVYDVNGNEPGKAVQQQQPNPGPSAAPQPTNGGGWGQSAPNPQPAQQQPQGQQAGGWQPGAAGVTGSPPPWGASR
jgi:hypothetical protein